MAKWRVGLTYFDNELKKELVKDKIVEMTVKRANQVNKALEKYGTALHRLEDK